jgi:hypothetical protein
MKPGWLIWMAVALALSAVLQRRIRNPFAAEVVFMWVFCGWPILVITILILIGYIDFALKLIFRYVPSP